MKSKVFESKDKEYYKTKRRISKDLELADDFYTGLTYAKLTYMEDGLHVGMMYTYKDKSYKQIRKLATERFLKELKNEK